MEYTSKRTSDMHLLRAAVLKGEEPPMAVVMRLEAQGVDVSTLMVRIRHSLPLLQAVA